MSHAAFLIVMPLFFREFAQIIPRDFTLRYDPYTQCVKVLNSEYELKELAKELEQQ